MALVVVIVSAGNAIKYAYELFNGVQANASFLSAVTVFVIFIDWPLTSNWKRKKTTQKVENLTRKAQKKGKNQGH